MPESLDSTENKPSRSKLWAVISDGFLFILSAAGVALWLGTARQFDFRHIAELVMFLGLAGLSLCLLARDVKSENSVYGKLDILVAVLTALMWLIVFPISRT